MRSSSARQKRTNTPERVPGQSQDCIHNTRKVESVWDQRYRPGTTGCLIATVTTKKQMCDARATVGRQGPARRTKRVIRLNLLEEPPRISPWRRQENELF